MRCANWVRIFFWNHISDPTSHHPVNDNPNASYQRKHVGTLCLPSAVMRGLEKTIKVLTLTYMFGWGISTFMSSLPKMLLSYYFGSLHTGTFPCHSPSLLSSSPHPSLPGSLSLPSALTFHPLSWLLSSCVSSEKVGTFPMTHFCPLSFTQPLKQRLLFLSLKYTNIMMA